MHNKKFQQAQEDGAHEEEKPKRNGAQTFLLTSLLDDEFVVSNLDEPVVSTRDMVEIT